MSKTGQYIKYVRPLSGKLIRGVALDAKFVSGHGNWLVRNFHNKQVEVLDFAGGYGANLLGHKNPELVNEMVRCLKEAPPFHLQASIRDEAAILAESISERLTNETSKGHWISHFSNSGTEAVEAALKMTHIYYKKRIEKIKQQLLIKRNLFCLKFPERKKECYALYEDQCQKLAGEAWTASLVGGYHGKTLGALNIVGNPYYKKEFLLAGGHLLLLKSIDEARDQITDTALSLDYYDHESNEVRSMMFYPIASIIVEAIQGEGGIMPLEQDYLNFLRQFCSEQDILFVCDEIQSGIYRTGKFAALGHYNLVADIYCFSKALGGGITKIGITAINYESYIEEFGLLHTSTFAEDSYSSSIAKKVLDLLDESTVSKGMEYAGILIEQLNSLRKEFPDVIKEIRGIGLLLGLEFQGNLRELGREVQLFSTVNMTGYFFSSVLLNQENIRVAPGLSNEMTIRIEPSIYIREEEINFLIFGLRRFCEKLREFDQVYLLGHLFDNMDIQKHHDETLLWYDVPSQRKEKRPFAVFLCHLIDPVHAKYLFPSVKHVPDDVVTQKIYDFALLQEFQWTILDKLKGNEGREIDIALMSVNLFSSEIVLQVKKNRQARIIEKIQEAIDFAVSAGATVIGLGQFTSIVSSNGLVLDSRGASLTTGNSLTVGYAIEATLREADSMGIPVNERIIAGVGAAGNIMSVGMSLLADHAKKLILIYHTPIAQSPKWQQTSLKMLRDIQASASSSPCVQGVKMIMNEINWDGQDLAKLLSHPHLKEFIVFDTNLSLCRLANVVVCGASAPKPILGEEHIGGKCVVVDISVPPNVKPEVHKMEGVRVIFGGVVKLPFEQSIRSPGLPLPKGEIFACMGETFTLGLMNQQQTLAIGDLSKNGVLKTVEMAKKVGLNLGRVKKLSSF